MMTSFVWEFPRRDCWLLWAC